MERPKVSLGILTYNCACVVSGRPESPFSQAMPQIAGIDLLILHVRIKGKQSL